MRECREQATLMACEPADVLGRDPGKVSRMKNGPARVCGFG